LRKFWKDFLCELPADFPRPSAETIEKKYNIRIISCAIEQVTDELFKRYYRDFGFETILPCRSPDYVGIKRINGRLQAFTIELEVWSSQFGFHKYIVDYIFCLEKDQEWPYSTVIEFRTTLGIKEFMPAREVDHFLYEKDEEFRKRCDEYHQRKIEKKMGLI
jgi:hypothetical protein